MSKRTLPILLADGVYALTGMVGSGGMASVYRAFVDLEYFDYGALLTQALETRSARRNQAEPFSDKGSALFREECLRQGIPVPAKQVAVKVLPVGDQTMCSQRFRDEWLSVIGNNHPNLIHVYGGGVDKQARLQYYAMELVPGVLSTHDVTGLSLANQLRLGAQAAAGLAELHDRNMAHRDVKPGNLLCYRHSKTGRYGLKIVDFGVHKDFDRSMSLTKSRQMLGTPHYLAPEVVDDGRRVTSRTDIYGLGASLYHWICGRPPYADRGVFGVLGQLVTGVPPTPAGELALGLPKPVDDLIREMLAFDPDDRPADMHEVRERLEQAIEMISSGESVALVPLSEPAPGASGRVLLVEDNPVARHLLKRMLESEQYEVDCCADGANALIKAASGQYDLMIVDEQLPDINGLHALRVLRTQGYDTPAILCSAAFDSEPDLKDRAEAAGVAALAKPINVRDLTMVIERVMARSA